MDETSSWNYNGFHAIDLHPNLAQNEYKSYRCLSWYIMHWCQETSSVERPSAYFNRRD